MVHLCTVIFEAAMEDLTLRDYRAGDSEAMHALDVVCFEPAFQFSRKAMRSFAEARGAITLLAEAHGELVGFCVVQMEQQMGYVVTLDVAASWRRQGLARKLMQEMEARVRAAGGLGMVLHVHKGNHGAMRFYESM